MYNFLFVSSENDGIENCKVGGVGDVIRDVPKEIARKGDKVHVVVPSYSRLHKKGRLISRLNFDLRGMPYVAYLYKVKPRVYNDNIVHYVIHHKEIEPGNIENIYHHDLDEPFYTDAIKYIIFCTAVAQAIKQEKFGKIDIVHLHDWHTSLLLFLKRYHPAYTVLKDLRFIYCIHNLAIQGIRPFKNSYSSLETWFPKLKYSEEDIRDPRYPNCFNFMALGIRFADIVHTVSPTYKEEVLNPGKPPEFRGGEGLEEDLLVADEQGRFFGILNGADYPREKKKQSKRLFESISSAVIFQLQQEVQKSRKDFLAHTAQKLLPFIKKRPPFICASVARLTEQKFYFYKKSPAVLNQILEKLKTINGIYILLGTGASEYEHFLRKVSYKNKNFVFLNFQAEEVIENLYAKADLYLMPSLFEPCGISQMLAMRNGQPCLVHETGGLKDTVSHELTGFSFGGNSYEEKVKNLSNCFESALNIFVYDKETWNNIRNNARKMRFTWKNSVKSYYSTLYCL